MQHLLTILVAVTGLTSAAIVPKRVGISGYPGFQNTQAFASLSPYIGWYSDYNPDTPGWQCQGRTHAMGRKGFPLRSDCSLSAEVQGHSRQEHSIAHVRLLRAWQVNIHPILDHSNRPQTAPAPTAAK